MTEKLDPHWRARVAKLVNTNWIYSAHWPVNTEDAAQYILDDIRTLRIEYMRRMDDLKEAERIAKHAFKAMGIPEPEPPWPVQR